MPGVSSSGRPPEQWMEFETAVHGIQPRRPVCHQRGLRRRPIGFKRRPPRHAPRLRLAPDNFGVVLFRCRDRGLVGAELGERHEQPAARERGGHLRLSDAGFRDRVSTFEIVDNRFGFIERRGESGRRVRLRMGQHNLPIRYFPPLLMGGDGRIRAAGQRLVDGPDIGSATVSAAARTARQSLTGAAVRSRFAGAAIRLR